jgi:hypothetical protein
MVVFLVSLLLPTSEALASAHFDPTVNGILQCCQPSMEKSENNIWREEL